MSFISCIIVLNVSIILMMIIAFSNITFVYQIQSLKLYQLANFTDPDYEVYLLQGIKPYEKKMNIYEYFRSVHNFNFIKFKLSGEKTWEERFVKIEILCRDYQTVEYEAQNYYLNKFKKIIYKLTKCTKFSTKCPDNVFSLGKDKPKSILEIVNKILNDTKPEENASSCSLDNLKHDTEPKENASSSSFDSLKHDTEPKENASSSSFDSLKHFINKFKRENTLYLEKSIEAIDKALKSEECIRTFYQCFQIFKFEVIDMKIEKANHPIMTSHINIAENTQLKEKEKKEILQFEDVKFLSSNKLYDNEKSIKSWLQSYTGYNPYEGERNSAYSECLRNFRGDPKEDKWMFKLTQLSYRYIYPSKSETLSSYKIKRQIMIKNLKLLEYHIHSDDKRKRRFESLEDANSKVDQDYFDLMKNCRALSGEDVYDVYVMRLINTECRPLGEPEWKNELKDAGKKNAVALLQMKMENKLQ